MGDLALQPSSTKTLIVLLLTVVFIPPLSHAHSLRSSSDLELSPSTFEMSAGDSLVLTATLTSDGEPLPDRFMGFAASVGIVNPLVGITNEEGKMKVTYTAPLVSIRTSVKIAASFLGDLSYKGSGATSSGTVQPELVLSPTDLPLSPSTFELESGESTNLTAKLTSNGEPLSGKPIRFVATLGDVSPNAGTTDDQGKVTVMYTAPVFSTEGSISTRLHGAIDRSEVSDCTSDDIC